MKRSVRKKNLSKDELVAGAFLQVQSMSRRSGKTSRETLKAVHPDAYRSFKKKYDRLFATRRDLKLRKISAMRELYEACKRASTVPRQSQLTPDRILDG